MRGELPVGETGSPIWRLRPDRFSFFAKAVLDRLRAGAYRGGYRAPRPTASIASRHHPVYPEIRCAPKSSTNINVNTSLFLTKPLTRNPRPIVPGVRIGHVHLKVADLDRALAFYTGVLGFDLMQRFGDQAAFISAGGYHHHIGLNTWESKSGASPARGTTGLYHLAIVYPTRADLADALRRVIAAGISLDGASDHGVSEALYLRDPDQNGVELYWDRPETQWPHTADGNINMKNEPLDVRNLLAEAKAG